MYRCDSAGFFRRVAALLLDYFVLWVLVEFVLGALELRDPFAAAAVADPLLFVRQPVDTATLVLLAMFLGYFTLLEGIWGMTIGKLAFGISVSRMNNKRMNMLVAVVRNVLRPVDMVLCALLVGAVLVIAGPNRRRLGDYFASTVVVEGRTWNQVAAAEAFPRTARFNDVRPGRSNAPVAPPLPGGVAAFGQYPPNL